VAPVAYPDLSNLQVVEGYLALAGLFVLREIASGALKEAGKDLWGWVRTWRTMQSSLGPRRGSVYDEVQTNEMGEPRNSPRENERLRHALRNGESQ
jgi:hypothetical protein